MNISTGFTGADGGYYHVTLDYEKVFQSKDRYQCDMFAAELKGRLSAASREKELLAKLEQVERALEEAKQKMALSVNKMCGGAVDRPVFMDARAAYYSINEALKAIRE